MRTKRYWIAFLAVLGVLLTANPAFAKDDRVSFANDITVDDGSAAGDLVCILCSVKVKGEVHGDVVTLLGSVRVDDSRTISGDVASVGGNVSLGEGGTINGDVSVVGGELDTGQGASIGGSRNVMAGRGWLLIPFAPLFIFIGAIWLIVWFVTRNRYRFPIYPQGRGF